MSLSRASSPTEPAISAQEGKSTSQTPVSSRARGPKRLIQKLPEGYIVPLAGGLAGAVAGIVTCPLDVIKTKLQAQGGFIPTENGVKLPVSQYRGVIGTAATIVQEDGFKGMYRGLGPMMLGYVPTWAVYLTIYNKAQGYFRTKTGRTDLYHEERLCADECRTDNWFLANVYASLCGGTCSTMATNPIWVIKTRLMSQTSSRTQLSHIKTPWQYRGTWDAARVMYQKEGLMSFYSGLVPALLGLTHVAIQFPMYEVFKEKFTGISRGQSETEEDQSHHFYGLASAVFLSKVCASTATYPHEVVRTRLQTQQRGSHSSEAAAQQAVNQIQKAGDHGRPPGKAASPNGNGAQYRGTWQTCKVILAEEGWRGFYAGLGTNLIRAIPSAMTTILTYEYLKKTMLHLRQDDDPREAEPRDVGRAIEFATRPRG